MLRSGFFVTGANMTHGHMSTPDFDDGVLIAYEASQLNFQRTELAVPSDYETGLGEKEAGEGVFGLRRALQVAGEAAVLMSL